MITPAAVRVLALALPEAVESSHFEVADFRVRKKIFATIHPSGERGALLRLDPDLVANLISTAPTTFALAGAGGRTILVEFARVARDQYAALLIEAWRGTAPKRVVAAYDAAATSPSPRTRTRARRQLSDAR